MFSCVSLDFGETMATDGNRKSPDGTLSLTTHKSLAPLCTVVGWSCTGEVLPGLPVSERPGRPARSSDVSQEAGDLQARSPKPGKLSLRAQLQGSLWVPSDAPTLLTSRRGMEACCRCPARHSGRFWIFPSCSASSASPCVGSGTTQHADGARAA